MIKPWFQINNQQVALRILAKPNAKQTAIVEISAQELHIMLHAKPHQGEANKELIAYLAKFFRLPKRQIILQRGEKSKYKQVIVPLTATVQRFLDNPNKLIPKSL